MVVGSNPVFVTSTSDIAPVSGKDFLGIQATIEYRFALNAYVNDNNMESIVLRCKFLFFFLYYMVSLKN